MRKNIICILVLALVIVVSGASFAGAAAAPTFVDVPADHWAYPAVKELVRVGIIDGYNDRSFKGDKTMTRYEMASIVEKAMANSTKATAIQKALIDKLAIEFAMELNKLDTRVKKLEQNQPNIKLNGSYLVQYKMKDPSVGGSTSQGQWQFRLNGAAKVDENTTLGFRFANPAPTASKFRDATALSFGDFSETGGGNAAKVDRIFATTKIGALNFTVGRQAMAIDPEDIIIDSAFFSYDGLRFKWAANDVTFDIKHGRFAKSITDTYAFNGKPASSFANVDIDSFMIASKAGNFSWDLGYASFTNPKITPHSLMTYFFGNLGYLFTDKFSMAAELGSNQEAPGGKYWSVKAVSGDQSLNAAGKKHFYAQYSKLDANTIATAYTGLDQISEGKSDAFKTLDLGFKYAFSKNMTAKIQHVDVTDKTTNSESYEFWKLQMIYKF